MDLSTNHTIFQFGYKLVHSAPRLNKKHYPNVICSVPLRPSWSTVEVHFAALHTILSGNPKWTGQTALRRPTRLVQLSTTSLLTDKYANTVPRYKSESYSLHMILSGHPKWTSQTALRRPTKLVQLSICGFQSTNWQICKRSAQVQIRKLLIITPLHKGPSHL